ncbi:VOC family protein [Corynebacterium sp. TAE3-ERU12]|uniref:VOC family protein n=1 Tax=Corynebacterium sp. TAE3-ERU12 TaxID=2849491 RepID=UPI001C437DAF|nr:VOC family protein [Corynebacterium sp. TAE3-ERU12]MBV7294402.1 VOC family protein [Corynebacterium sp. TAE3-ERU12]
MPAFPAVDGMPLRADLLTTNPGSARDFYQYLFGWSYQDSTEGRTMSTLEGLPISAVLDSSEDNRWRVCFHADDVADTLTRARDLGAKVLHEPQELADGSHMAVFEDPTGALVGLLRQPGQQSFFAAGEPGAPVWFELIAGEKFDEAVNFYHELFGWNIAIQQRTADEGVAIAMHDGAAFAGISTGTVSAWSGWVAYFGVLDINAAVKTTKKNGGEVAVPPADTEFGPMATVVDSVGATTILCEVPPPPPEDIRESDPLEGIDLSQFGM